MLSAVRSHLSSALAFMPESHLFSRRPTVRADKGVEIGDHLGVALGTP